MQKQQVSLLKVFAKELRSAYIELLGLNRGDGEISVSIFSSELTKALNHHYEKAFSGMKYAELEKGKSVERIFKNRQISGILSEIKSMESKTDTITFHRFPYNTEALFSIVGFDSAASFIEGVKNATQEERRLQRALLDGTIENFRSEIVLSDRLKVITSLKCQMISFYHNPFGQLSVGFYDWTGDEIVFKNKLLNGKEITYYGVVTSVTRTNCFIDFFPRLGEADRDIEEKDKEGPLMGILSCGNDKVPDSGFTQAILTGADPFGNPTAVVWKLVKVTQKIKKAIDPEKTLPKLIDFRDQPIVDDEGRVKKMPRVNLNNHETKIIHFLSQLGLSLAEKRGNEFSSSNILKDPFAVDSRQGLSLVMSAYYYMVKGNTPKAFKQIVRAYRQGLNNQDYLSQFIYDFKLSDKDDNQPRLQLLKLIKEVNRRIEHREWNQSILEPQVLDEKFAYSDL